MNPTATQIIDNLAALVVRLTRFISKDATPGSRERLIVDSAMDLLKRYGLSPSPLREVESLSDLNQVTAQLASGEAVLPDPRPADLAVRLTALERLMPEVLTSLRQTGQDVSLVADLEKALQIEPGATALKKHTWPDRMMDAIRNVNSLQLTGEVSYTLHQQSDGNWSFHGYEDGKPVVIRGGYASEELAHAAARDRGYAPQSEGPDHEDGCDSEGFKGGCERMGHTPESCPTVLSQIHVDIEFLKERVDVVERALAEGKDVSRIEETSTPTDWPRISSFGTVEGKPNVLHFYFRAPVTMKQGRAMFEALQHASVPPAKPEPYMADQVEAFKTAFHEAEANYEESIKAGLEAVQELKNGA